MRGTHRQTIIAPLRARAESRMGSRTEIKSTARWRERPKRRPAYHRMRRAARC